MFKLLKEIFDGKLPQQVISELLVVCKPLIPLLDSSAEYLTWQAVYLADFFGYKSVFK